MPDIFLHIPKTGGMSIRALLASQYSVSAIMPVPVHPDAVISCEPYPVQYLPDDQVQGWVQQNKHRYLLVMGHLDWSIVGDDRVMTMLRNPVDRLISFYYYVAQSKDGGAKRLWAQIGNLGLEGWLDSPLVESQLNLQTRYLSPRLHSLDQAKARLQHTVFGVMESFESSLAHIELVYRYQFRRPLLHQNRSKIATKVSSVTRRKIADMQPLDMALYEWACEELLKRGVNAYSTQ